MERIEAKKIYSKKIITKSSWKIELAKYIMLQMSWTRIKRLNTSDESEKYLKPND